MPLSINVKNIPSDPWVYIFKDEKGSILYIGKAKNLQKRIQQYFNPGSLRKQEMMAQAFGLDFHVVKNESEALYLEDNLIKKNQPYFNNLLKADNSYCYIKITDEDFPQILLTRKKLYDKATYIGPKHNTQNLKRFLQYLRQVLQFRWCKTTQFRQGKMCSDYYFWLCKGRCALAKNNTLDSSLSRWSHTESRKPGGDAECIWGRGVCPRPDKKTKLEYQKIMQTIISFFKGNTKPIKDVIKEQIHQASQQNNFERAGKLRDIFLEIDNLTEQQTVVLPEKTTGYMIQVRPVGQRRIYIILYFYEGKLIDIIRHKEHQNDKESDEIIFDLQREFWTLYEQKVSDGLMFSTIKKLSSKSKKALLELSDHFAQSYIINSSFSESNLMNDLLATLQKRYQLKKFPYRIECVDISHLSWWRVSWGLSCLLWGIKYPHGYRKYKISSKLKAGSLKSQDDYASLKELIERRIKNEELPDLLVIDWWKWQLNVIKKIMKESPELKKILEKIDILSLGKWEARKKIHIWTISKKGLVTEKIFAFTDSMTIHEENMVYDDADKILIQARNEAHRFANAYRKAQMSKEFKK